MSVFAGPASGFIPSDRLSSGTHRAEMSSDGSKVIVRNVELWSEIEGDADKDRLERVAAATNKARAEGRLPKLLLTHADDAPVVGALASDCRVEISPKNGKLTLFGDYEMSPQDFEAYTLSNKYPNRSVEIRANGEIHAVSLLGREPPRADLPDIRFSDPNTRRYTSEIAINFTNPEPHMTVSEMLAKCADELAKATPEDQKKYAAQCGAIAKRFSADEEETEEEKAKRLEKENMDKNSNTDTINYAAQVASLQTAINQSQATIAQLQRDNVTAKYSQQLATLKNIVGYSTIDIAEEMTTIYSLPDDKARDAHLARIQKNYKQTPTGASIAAAGASLMQYGLQSPPDSGSNATENFALATPEGRDAAGKLHQRISKYATEKGVSYEEAAKIVK